MHMCKKNYDGETEWWCFEDDLLKKLNTVSDKVSTDVKKEFDSKPLCNKNCLKTKIKSYWMKL